MTRFSRRLVTIAVSAIVLPFNSAMAAMDLNPLWDFQNPKVSEERFRAALADASPDDRLVIETQIARTFGLRRDFAKAREVLAAIAPSIAAASPEAQARYYLELGRTYASAAHKDPSAADRETARANFMKANDIAGAAKLDYLAIDALHMMPFVDTEPAKQLEWNERAIAIAQRSDQPDAKRWEGSLRNNLGYAKHLKGDYDAALREFRLSRAVFEAAAKPREVRIADWMIAWTLRAQKKYPEALAMQLELDRQWSAAGEPDPYVWEELEAIYRALGNASEAEKYAAKIKAAKK